MNKTHMQIDPLSFRHVMGSFATGVAVVTTMDHELGRIGLTINSLTSVSLDPPLVLFCLEKSAFVHKVFKRTETFALNFLSAGQEDVSRYFADRHHHAKPKSLWDKDRPEPLVRGTLGWVLCKRYAFYKGGDHTIIVGEVTDLHRRSGTQNPLLYFRGHYRDLAKLTSGART